MQEADIQRDVMKELSNLGAIVWRNNTGMLRDQNGTPVRFGLCVGSSDIIGIWKGKFLAVEVKTPRGKVTDAQLNFIEAVNRAGGIAFVARSKKDVKNVLTHLP